MNNGTSPKVTRIVDESGSVTVRTWPAGDPNYPLTVIEIDANDEQAGFGLTPKQAAQLAAALAQAVARVID